MAVLNVGLLDPQRRFVRLMIYRFDELADVKPVGFEPTGMVRMSMQWWTGVDNRTGDGKFMLKICCRRSQLGFNRLLHVSACGLTCCLSVHVTSYLLYVLLRVSACEA